MAVQSLRNHKQDGNIIKLTISEFENKIWIPFRKKGGKSFTELCKAHNATKSTSYSRAGVFFHSDPEYEPILKRYGIKITAPTEMRKIIDGKLIIREIGQNEKISSSMKKFHDPKNCTACGELYKPSGTTDKWCPSCKKAENVSANRERINKKRELERNKKETRKKQETHTDEIIPSITSDNETLDLSEIYNKPKGARIELLYQVLSRYPVNMCLPIVLLDYIAQELTSDDLRFHIRWERDFNRCLDCGGLVEEKAFHLGHAREKHHLTGLSKEIRGFETLYENIGLWHVDCNQKWKASIDDTNRILAKIKDHCGRLTTSQSLRQRFNTAFLEKEKDITIQTQIPRVIINPSLT